jgi:hypothetical protein
MPVLKANGIDWHEIKYWSGICTWSRFLNSDCTKGREEVWSVEQELENDAVFFVHSVQNFKASNLQRKALKDMENWKWEEKIIHCVKYSDYLVLLAVQGTAIHGMFDRINKIENMLWEGQKFVKSKIIYTIALCNSVVPTRSVRQVILSPADRCGSPNHI